MPALPSEIWAHIMQYCDWRSHRDLALVSRSCSLEARRLLYQSVSFEESRSQRNNLGTPIFCLSLFFRSLSSTSHWHRTLEKAYIDWWEGKGEPWFSKDAGIENRSRMDDLVCDTANLLSKSEKLRNIHLSISRTNSAVPFAVPYLTSLSIPITVDHWDNPPDFNQLLRLFQIPTLQQLRILAMQRTNSTVPEELRQPGTSNVTHLTFEDCGWVAEELFHIIAWPKELHTLHFVVDDPSYRGRIPPGAGFRQDFNAAMRAIRPCQQSLQDFRLTIHHNVIGDRDLELPSDTGFEGFPCLKKIDVIIEMLMELPDHDLFWPDDDPTERMKPPIHTRLPKTLEELSLHMDDEPRLCAWAEPGESASLTQVGRELFGWLCGLIEHKHMFPNLNRVKIKRLYPRDNWNEDLRIKEIARSFQDAGITLWFGCYYDD